MRNPQTPAKIALGKILFFDTRLSRDGGAFKTPSLRNVAARPPYMHDGSIATLAEVIAFYNRGGGEGQKSDLIHPLSLTEDDQEDLLVFLKSLSGTTPKIERPDFSTDH